jgi:hypothetical protein
LILAQAKTEALTETNWNKKNINCYQVANTEHELQATFEANLTAQAKT